tara:strand:+ start:262 stop:870 length:609 start_codon:yes stop_codon:yes gene_type:complete
MKYNPKTLQIGLGLLGSFLILSTYFLYPFITNKKNIIEKSVTELLEKKPLENLDNKDIKNIFEDVEYKGVFGLDNSFVIKSKDAYILPGSSELVYMNNMNLLLYLNDGRVVNIFGTNGVYNKKTYDCFFENDVKASDGEIIIKAENLDLLSSEKFAKIYNNVVLTNKMSELKADKIDYNFETKYYKVSMINNNDHVKVKLIK